MLILHGLGDGITTFNRLPIHIARHSERLMRLAAAPFSHFRFFGREYVETGQTYPLDLLFLHNTMALGPIARVNARPVVFWSAEDNAVDLAQLILDLNPMLMLFIHEKTEQLARFAILNERPTPVASLMALDTDGHPFADLSRRIWTAYLELIERLFAYAKAPNPAFTFYPWMDEPTPLSAVIEAARQGTSPWCGDADPESIPNDYVGAPNYILLSLLEDRTPPWSREALPPDEAQRRSVEMARRILATRGLGNIVSMLKRTTGLQEPDGPLFRALNELVPQDYLQRVIDWTRLPAVSPESSRLLHELTTDPAAPPGPPQLILLCPGAADVSADQIVIPPGLQGPPGEAVQREPAYYRHLFERMVQAGRRVEIEAPENPDQQLILDLVGRMVRGEAQHLSAIGMLYAGRFSCPVLKLDRVDRTVIGAFKEVNLFHLVGVDSAGGVVVRKRCSRTQLLAFTANVRVGRIGMEACSGAHFLGRALQAQGHDVRLMPAQYVKPYVKTNKSDYIDAEAIAEAVQRWVMRRTAVINQVRGLLLEHGLTLPKGRHHVDEALPEIAADAESKWSDSFRVLLTQLKLELEQLTARIEAMDRVIQQTAMQDEACQRLTAIPGVGPVTATALVAAIGNGSGFRRGRDLAAWVGMVPREHSTGGKQKLLGISKHGNSYLRKLFVQGARAVMRYRTRQSPALSSWLAQLLARTHQNVAIVALANKLLRMAWAVLCKNETYRSPVLLTSSCHA